MLAVRVKKPRYSNPIFFPLEMKDKSKNSSLSYEKLYWTPASRFSGMA